MKTRAVRYLLVICTVATFPRAQQLPGSTEFDVASLKPWTSREIGGVYTYPGGRVEFRGCTLQYLIEQAFNVQPFQVSGGPGWMQDERYDIDAKPPTASKSSHSMPPYSKAPLNDEQRQMLQLLLVERFQLKYHRETRQGSVYLLVKGTRRSKLVDSADKSQYPWAGGIPGGMISGNGLAGVNENMEGFGEETQPVFTAASATHTQDRHFGIVRFQIGVPVERRASRRDSDDFRLRAGPRFETGTIDRTDRENRH